MPGWILALAFALGIATTALLLAAAGPGPNDISGGLNARGAAGAGAIVAALVLFWGATRRR